MENKTSLSGLKAKSCQTFFSFRLTPFQVKGNQKDALSQCSLCLELSIHLIPWSKKRNIFLLLQKQLAGWIDFRLSPEEGDGILLFEAQSNHVGCFVPCATRYTDMAKWRSVNLILHWLEPCTTRQFQFSSGCIFRQRQNVLFESIQQIVAGMPEGHPSLHLFLKLHLLVKLLHWYLFLQNVSHTGARSHREYQAEASDITNRFSVCHDQRFCRDNCFVVALVEFYFFLCLCLFKNSSHFHPGVNLELSLNLVKQSLVSSFARQNQERKKEIKRERERERERETQNITEKNQLWLTQVKTWVSFGKDGFASCVPMRFKQRLE